MNRYFKFTLLIIVPCVVSGCDYFGKNSKISTTGNYPQFKDFVDVDVYNDTNGKINVSMKSGEATMNKSYGFIDPQKYWEIKPHGKKSFKISYNDGESEIWFFEKNNSGLRGP